MFLKRQLTECKAHVLQMQRQLASSFEFKLSFRSYSTDSLIVTVEPGVHSLSKLCLALVLGALFSWHCKNVANCCNNIPYFRVRSACALNVCVAPLYLSHLTWLTDILPVVHTCNNYTYLHTLNSVGRVRNLVKIDQSPSILTMWLTILVLIGRWSLSIDCYY